MVGSPHTHTSTHVDTWSHPTPHFCIKNKQLNKQKQTFIYLLRRRYGIKSLKTIARLPKCVKQH